MSNIQPYIILNGTDSRTISGLLISALAPISKPLQRTLVDTVDGRDGDLVTPLGFSAYDKTISIALTYGYDIDDIIEYFNSEGVVTFSNEPDKYYRYAIYEQIDFERLIRFKTAEVTLHCQPFKFSTTETPKLFNVTSGSPITVKNDGNYQSRPNLTIIGSGDVDLSLNGSQVLSLDLEDNQAIIIDTEDMNAYAAQTAIKEVIAEINPVQELHGQEYPYPAGGGKNKLITTLENLKSLNTTGTWSNNVYTNGAVTYTVQTDGDGNVTGISVNGNNTGGTNTLTLGGYTITEGTYTLTGCASGGSTSSYYIDVRNDNNGQVIDSGNGASFTSAGQSGKVGRIVVVGGATVSNLLFKPMLRLSTTSSDFAPSSNICGISGFTESNVKLYGVNVWGGETMADDCVNAVNNTSYCYKGSDEVGNYVAIRASNYVSVPFFTNFKPNTQYTIKVKVSKEGNPANKSTNYVGKYTDGTSLVLSAPDNFSDNNVQSYVVTSQAGKSLAYIQGNFNSGTTRFYYDECGVFEGVLTAADFVPYLGSEYTIEFVDAQGDPITAYKGRINFTTGVLTLDGQVVDMGSITYNSGFNGYYTTIYTNVIKLPDTAENSDLICSCYKVGNAVGGDNLFIQPSGTYAGYIIIRPSATYVDTNAFRTALIGQQLVYPLATPIEIQLTPTIINNLLGLNQMYADNNGDISVTFSSNGVIQTETGDIVSFNVAVEDMQKGILLNRLVVGNYDKIRLSKGDNTIVLTGGAQQFVIDKYSRWL